MLWPCSFLLCLVCFGWNWHNSYFQSVIVGFSLQSHRYGLILLLCWLLLLASFVAVFSSVLQKCHNEFFYGGFSLCLIEYWVGQGTGLSLQGAAGVAAHGMPLLDRWCCGSTPSPSWTFIAVPWPIGLPSNFVGWFVWNASVYTGQSLYRMLLLHPSGHRKRKCYRKVW